MHGNKYCLIGRQPVALQPRKIGSFAAGGVSASGFLLKFRPF